MNENKFRERLIKDLEAKGLPCINLHRGIFDIYIPFLKRFIELKKVVDLSRTPNTSEHFGIRFTKCETEALRILYKLQAFNELPLIAIMDETDKNEKYHVIHSHSLKKFIEKPSRINKKKMIVSMKHFNENPLSYNQILNEIIKLEES